MEVSEQAERDAPPERFIRRISRGGGKLQGKLFLCREGERGISLYARMAELDSDDALPAFQQYYKLRSGDLPAVWPLLLDDLVHVKLEAHVVRQSDHYGHLHWETTECPNEEQAEQLAMRVTQRGPLLSFVRALAG